MTQGTGQALYRRAKTRIPGGTQLLSKRPEMFLPEQWPAYYSRAQGRRGRGTWTATTTSTCATTASAPACSATPIPTWTRPWSKPRRGRVDVHAELRPRRSSWRSCSCELHPWAEMVRYARCGGEAMAVAVRIARAATGRDRVAFCGYHGWHDWYLAANLAEQTALDGHLLPGLDPSGRAARPARHRAAVPLQPHRRARRPSSPQHGPELAAIVMEPIRNDRARRPGSSQRSGRICRSRRAPSWCSMRSRRASA